jgi:hypothetical protein
VSGNVQQLPRRVEETRLAEVVAGLSQALDLTGGQSEGHAARSCLIGVRVAEVIGLPPADRSALFWALLLKDAGCSVNASQVSAMFGADDHAVKRGTASWTRPTRPRKRASWPAP